MSGSLGREKGGEVKRVEEREEVGRGRWVLGFFFRKINEKGLKSFSFNKKTML